MSEKFGLDWKDHDYVRMSAFVVIMDELAKQRQSGGQTEPVGKRHFRKMM